MLENQIINSLKKIKLPLPDSHKGQNGKLLIIGGSELFHAASKWSLDIGSKFVDMVFYCSIPQNNELIKEAKGQFWNGIVVNREHLENYINEADAILIGPGMERTIETEQLVNHLLMKFSDKKWVIDAGALQMMQPQLLNSRCIITPHKQELAALLQKIDPKKLVVRKEANKTNYFEEVRLLKNTGATIILKGQIDYIFYQNQVVEVEGGNAGMTKGGTGDVLAGLVAALYCQHDSLTAAVVGSYINKKAGEKLYQEVGPFFNASDLVTAIPETMWSELQLLR